MSSRDTLSAASQDRKARLAQLKSLKRKQPSTAEEESVPNSTELEVASKPTDIYLSGRNFDTSTRSAKLGFEGAPVADPTSTLEYKAEQLELETKAQAQKEEEEGKPLDLFKLQPKKPNWDLKRDLEDKMRTVDVWTENAIARLVRERVEGQKKIVGVNREDGEVQEVGMEGSELVEAMHLREKEEEIEREREEMDADVS